MHDGAPQDTPQSFAFLAHERNRVAALGLRIRDSPVGDSFAELVMHPTRGGTVRPRGVRRTFE